jgi:hypothetical protein
MFKKILQRLQTSLDRVAKGACASLVMALLAGCGTLGPIPAANFSEPGWTIQQGQAIWRRDRDAAEIAGEILFATNARRSVLQFTKTPFPLIIAQTTSEGWQLEAPVEDRRFSYRGTPPDRLIWFQLPRALSGSSLSSKWIWQSHSNSWSLENRSTGERLHGFLEPAK